VPRRRRFADGTGPVVLLLEEEGAGDSSPTAPVTIAVVPDPSKLLDERSAGLHLDVVDLLVELVVELVDEEGPDGEGEHRR
jgi:hypothetical protein